MSTNVTKVSKDVYVQKPQEVEAKRFTGWADAEEIISWLGLGFVVPKGYEHHMRYEWEKDRSNGHGLEDAPAFLVANIEGVKVRIDVLEWIVKDEFGNVEYYSNEAFAAKFDKKEL